MSLWHRVIHPITQNFRLRGQFRLRQFPSIRRARICHLRGSRHVWEKLRPGIAEQQITIYNIRQDVTTEAGDPSAEGGIRALMYEDKHLPVPDQAFDLLVCNSVLEHAPPEPRAGLALDMQHLFPRARIEAERIAGLTKSYYLICAAGDQGILP